jgi:hypothetical protein
MGTRTGQAPIASLSSVWQHDISFGVIDFNHSVRVLRKSFITRNKVVVYSARQFIRHRLYNPNMSAQDIANDVHAAAIGSQLIWWM